MQKENLQHEVSKARRLIGSLGPNSFAQVYLHDYLKYKPSKAHEELYELANDIFQQRHRYVVVAAPRGFGKTTMFGTIVILYALCCSKEKFIVVCSNTASQAQEKIDNVRKVLMENTLIQTDFPELFGSNKKMPSWSRDEIITANGIRVCSFGFQQKVRGLRYGSYRPSLVLIDDLDSENHATNFRQKNKVKDWFLGSLLKVGDENTNFILVGNVFHRFSVIGDLCSEKDHHDWEKHIYRALEQFPKRMDLWTQCWRIFIKTEEYQGTISEEGARMFYLDHKKDMDEEAILLWPQRYELFNLMMEYHRDPPTFHAELQNQPKEAVNEAFNPATFYFWEKSYKNLNEVIEFLGGDAGIYFATCDPSTGKQGMQGDNSAIVIVGIKNKTIYVLHADIRRRNINELIEDILSYCKKYTFRVFGIETNGGQEYFYQTVLEKAREAGINVNFQPIISKGDKISRIGTMAPPLRTGALQLCREHVTCYQHFKSGQITF